MLWHWVSFLWCLILHIISFQVSTASPQKKVGLKFFKGDMNIDICILFFVYINVWIVMFSQCLHAYNNNVWTFQLCFLWCCICIYVYLNQNSTSNNFWSRIQSSGIICKYFWKHKSILGIAILLSIYHKHFKLGSHRKIQCSWSYIHALWECVLS